ncbi:MAG: phosphoribosylglycinamide formyltransferase, partial [Acidobacteriota bacterium]
VKASRAGEIQARPAVVVSNRPKAAGLKAAEELGVETLVLDHRDFHSREEHEDRMVAVLKERKVRLVCLAGYMRLLSSVMLSAFPGAVLNIHPSLLPSFPGADAQQQALDYGVKVTGCTVHLVDGGLDAGPIIAQSAVDVLEGDSVESLSRRILVQEHLIYPRAVRLFFQGRLQHSGRRIIVRPAGAG